MGKLFLGAYRWIANKKWTSLFIILAFASGLIALGSRVQFEDDITALIPANEETKRIQRVLKSISFTDKIIVSIQKTNGASTEDLTEYASAFIDSLETKHSEFVKTIQGRVSDDDLPNTLNLVYDHLPLFLEPADYTTIRAKLSADSIAKITANNYRTLISPSGILAKKTIVKDPLGLSFLALKKLQELGIGDGFKINNGFLVNEEETHILLFITPTYGSGGTDKNIPFSDALYALQEQLNAKYLHKIKSDYYGAPLVAVANAKQIRHDIQFTVSIAMTILLILLIFFYRKITLPLILFTPTVLGVLLAIAFLAVLRTKISAISLGIGAVLLGVTLDYALHILTHIRNGKSIESLYQKVAPSIVMSSITTASAFLCLLFLESQALQDLGIFAAVSVLGASIFALLFIPQVYKTVKNENVFTFLDNLASFKFHQSKLAIGLLVLITIISLFTYRTVVFDKDLTKLNYESELLLDARARLEKLTDIGSKSIYLSTYGSNKEEVLQRNDSLRQQLQILKQQDQIISYSSISSLIPSNKKQQEQIDTWKQFWEPELVKATKENLIASGNTHGFKESTFQEFYGLLHSDFKPLQIADFEAIKSFSVKDFIVEDENGITATSLLKTDNENLQEIRAHFEKAPKTLLIDRQQVNESFLGNLKNDFNRLIGYSLVVVLLILFLFYRRLSLSLVTSIPIFLTWFLTVGIMGLVGIEFNIFNIIICSFIFGLGVDYSIFMTNALFTEFRTGEKILASHKTSIILSVITTIAGVGVMIFAKHPVLYTISLVSLIGILCAAFVSFIVQPLLFKLFIGNRQKRPISLRYLLHSILSFGYFGIGGFLLSLYAWIKLKIAPNSKMKPNLGFHKLVSKLKGSVLYTNPFVSKKISNPHQETFEKPAMLIANHTSFLDILAIGMLHPKIIFLVNDWVYNSPIFGSAAKLAGAFPITEGMEKGEAYLKEKVAQGFSLIAFPEGTRSKSNKIKRFHKGAFYLAERFQLDLLPVLIHGNSEVLPKGSFIIRDGSIHLAILDRIKHDDPRFGTNYTERTKNIVAFFRRSFRTLRNEIEKEDYWHKTLLEHYRSKGEAIYKEVKKDLKSHQNTYHKINRSIGTKDSIVHLSQSQGQLSLLLALDAIDRKISVFLEDSEARKLLKNNFLTHQYSNITVYDLAHETLEQPATVLLIDSDCFEVNSFNSEKIAAFDMIILLKKACITSAQMLAFGFAISEQSDNFMLLRKTEA